MQSTVQPIKTNLALGGIVLHIYSNGSLQSTTPIFDLVFAMHGRQNTYQSVEGYAHRILEENATSSKPTKRSVLVVCFDQRNHGHRTVDSVRNQGSIIYGTTQDITLVIRLLPSYIFRNGESKLGNVVVTGFSLGGHVTYMALSKGSSSSLILYVIAPSAENVNPYADPLIKAGVVICGRPDYPSLMSRRLISLSLNPAQREKVLLSPVFVETVKSVGPTVETLQDKDILILKGDNDNLVPFEGGREFIETLGNRVKVIGFPGVGHEFTDGMVDKGASWITEWLDKNL
ncbi:hypothetical protein KEM54_001557 [Ascosphaera aggregata]|nr:hypothetical protein KEM54_001557 [Ascosphaera aggregata]